MIDAGDAEELDVTMLLDEAEEEDPPVSSALKELVGEGVLLDEPGELAELEPAEEVVAAIVEVTKVDEELATL